MMGQAYDECCKIYDDVFEILHNPYISLFTDYLSQYTVLFSEKKSQEDNKKLLTYRHYAHLEDEMHFTYCRILERAGGNTLVDFDQREAYLKEWLEWARAIKCSEEEISALWEIFILYDSSTNANKADFDGQAQLKAAYELAINDSDFRETPLYCQLLQLMIDYYKGELDKHALYQELRNITPGIYGHDARSAKIYRCLRDYATEISDPDAVVFAGEVLRCDFDRFELERGFDVYTQFSDETQFIADLDALLRGMPELTEQCLIEVDAFLDEDGNDINPFDDGDSSENDEVPEKNDTIQGKEEKRTKYSSEFRQKVREVVKNVKQERERTRFAQRHVIQLTPSRYSKKQSTFFL